MTASINMANTNLNVQTRLPKKQAANLKLKFSDHDHRAGEIFGNPVAQWASTHQFSVASTNVSLAQ